MKIQLSQLLSVLALSCAFVIPAKAVTFTLDASSATLTTAKPAINNPHSDFYEVLFNGVVESGTQASTFSSIFGGNETTGWWITISFNGPQPFLTSAFIKAGDDKLVWDANDFTTFNSGVFDSIKLVQNGIANVNHKYKQFSHTGIDGRPGTNVPDGGTTALMLGLGLIGLGYAARRSKKA